MSKLKVDMKDSNRNLLLESGHGNCCGARPGEWRFFDSYRTQGLRNLDPLQNGGNGIKMWAMNFKDMPQNPKISAGFTYFGQFLAHDLSSQRLTTIDGSPGECRINLYSLYGAGPAMMPYLYLHYPQELETLEERNVALPDNNKYFYKGIKFRYRWNTFNGQRYYDVCRDDQEIALMADARNDQHFILSQFHIAMLHFHNAVADYFANKSEHKLKGDELFLQTRSVVVQCYRWVVVHQYLKLLVNDYRLVDNLLRDKASFLIFNPDEKPVLMPEFTEAALRVGHSQVREGYKFEKFHPLFEQSAAGSDLRGFLNRLDNANAIEMNWKFLFNFPGERRALKSMAIDYFIVEALHKLPFMSRSRDLSKRDLSKKIPAAFEYAGKLNLSNPLTPAEISNVLNEDKANYGSEVSIKNLHEIPLWLYLLMEAKIKGDGKNLGELGSRIVAEQIIWVLRNSIELPDEAFLDDFTRWRSDKDIEDLNGDAMAEARKFCIQDILEAPNNIKNIFSKIN